MKILFYIILLINTVYANVHQDIDASSCANCHSQINKEFESSMHKKSSIFDDKVHNAVWSKHPAKAKGNYVCAKCHTPNAKTIEEQKEAMACINCHSLDSLKDNGTKSTNNENMCISCHQNKMNSHKFEVCRTDGFDSSNTKENCITCHMPRVGEKDTIHTFHGFAGARKNPQMLSKYVELELNQNKNGFEISIENQAPHNLLTHPLRVVQLRTTLIKGSKEMALKTHTFVKIIGHNSEPTMPWAATEIVKDNMIKANEKRIINFDETLQSGDKVEVSIGFFVVNPKALEKLNLQNEEELKKFTVLKSKIFEIE